MGLGETSPGLQGSVNEGEEALRSDEGLVHIADRLLLVEAVLEPFQGRRPLAPEKMPYAVADAVGVMGEDPPVVTRACFGFGTVVPPAAWGEIGPLGELFIEDGRAEGMGRIVRNGGGLGKQTGSGQAGPGTEAGDDRTSGRESHIVPCLRRSH